MDSKTLMRFEALAGLGGGVQGMIQTAKDADLNLVIDGCDMDCSRQVFERAGVSNYRHFRVTDLGIQKAKPKAATEGEFAKVVSKAKEILGDTGCCTA